MQDPQAVFQRIQDKKKELKDLKQAYKDALSTSLEYKEIQDQVKALREKKKSIENTTKANFQAEFTKMDDLKIDIESDQEMLSDIVMTSIMNGTPVEIKDEYDNDYEPIFSVKFKKSL
jgi:hypothetical protein